MIRILDVYLNEDFVGLLSQDDAGELTFSYASDYLEAGGRKISLLFPVGGLTHTWTGVAVKAFFFRAAARGKCAATPCRLSGLI